MNSLLTKITKYILDFMFYAGILVTLTVYFILKGYSIIEPRITSRILELSIVLTLCGVLAIFILWQLRSIFKTVLNDNCFVHSNVVCLKRMGTFSFLIAIIMIVQMIIYPTLATTTIVLVFIIAGLFSKVLAQVFAKAIDYKEETDYTI